MTAALGAGVWLWLNRDGLAIETDDTPVTADNGEENVEVVVVRPLRAAERWYCPSSHPVAAYERGTYRPREYPREVAASERPVDCYSDVARAESAGYQREDPPPGVVLAGGVYLVPTVAPDGEACRILAGAVGFPAPCPTRLPAPGFAASCEAYTCTYGDVNDLRNGVVISYRTFPVPDDWSNDAEPNIVIAAVAVEDAASGRMRIDGPPELAGCTVDTPEDVGEQVRFVQCEPGDPWIPRFQGEPHQDHTAAFWRRGDVVYSASVDGHGPTADELLHALVDGITYVEPS
jgi:hypothetical protein